MQSFTCTQLLTNHCSLFKMPLQFSCKENELVRIKFDSLTEFVCLKNSLYASNQVHTTTIAHNTDVRRRGRNERLVIIPKAEYNT